MHNIHYQEDLFEILAANQKEILRRLDSLSHPPSASSALDSVASEVRHASLGDRRKGPARRRGHAIDVGPSYRSADPVPQMGSLIARSGMVFSWGHGHRCVRLKGHEYSLGSKQAQVIQILNEALANGTPDVPVGVIAERIDARTGALSRFRLKDLFKGKTEAYVALIRVGGGKGTVRLNV